ncbi:VOC family protein [Flavihumibacter rivuli]|uniref:VOC family protein n=1 Tax=Flavihumibacter rivuli TaxID=2838156 RepID=UPI001BDF4138|nr:VOC family protein [Flavihumibacter rivuli]ULQ55257.1 VOC family protein [Flavihumibacter rivuli]
MRLLSICFALVLFFLSPLSGQAQQKAGAGIRINHIALYVKDLKASADFYTGVLGLDTIPEPFHDGKHVWLAIGDYAHLHLIAGRSQEPVPGKNSHLCFSSSRLDAMIKTLEARKIHYEDWPGKANTVTRRVDGIRQIYIRDPDGYWVEVNDDFNQ